MGIILFGVCAVFILGVAAILIFSGSTGRRLLMLSLATGGGMSFIVRFFYAGYASDEITVLQVLAFPFLVFGTWGALMLILALKNR